MRLFAFVQFCTCNVISAMVMVVIVMVAVIMVCKGIAVMVI